MTITKVKFLKMGWIKNTEEKKPKIDERYKDKEEKYSVEVLIHFKNGLTFLGNWAFNENCWWSETTNIDDSEVLFWCSIPKLPSLA